MLSPAKLGLIAQTDYGALVCEMEKTATDSNGQITLHSIVQSLTTELLVKHAEHISSLVGLTLLEELSRDGQ